MPFTSDNQPENKGRKPGVPNKQTREVKEVINYMVGALKDGDLDAMLDYLKVNKPEAVLSFLAKIAPKDLNITNKEGQKNPVAEEIRKAREEWLSQQNK